MKVRFLGSGDAFGSGGRFQTCIHLESGTTQLLVDCGASSLIAMRRFGVDPQTIDTVILSHLHGDHFGGVPFLILDGQFKRRTRPLVVVGPPGVEARVREAMEVFFPGAARVERRFDTRFVELGDRVTVAVAPLAVTAFGVVHASGAPPFALRVACDGKIVTYSGDTEWTDSLIDAARGADLFIAEALFFDKAVKYHLDLATLLRHRAELDCRRLVVTHMSEDMLQRLDGLEVETAEDGKLVVV
ncbi:MAG: MBL fold metallo-hydrolase [Candidatus Rokuibacteriota bacterium]|nr:MAG: MBL fold metallo-hydrolase [Candidatus Rokubacteria bacterium]